MTDHSEAGSRSWRKYLRFRMRGLILFVLLFGVALGWLVRSAHIQRDAVAAIGRAGGQVLYEPIWPFAQRGLRAKRKASTPAWLTGSRGVDYLAGVRVVTLNGSSQVDDHTLDHIGRLSRLEGLELTGSSVRDSGLVHLKRLHNLRWLDLDNTRLTDAGIANLSGLTGLMALNLSDTLLTDQGFRTSRI